MIKYKTRSVKWGVDSKIEKVDIERESDNLVWFSDGIKALKDSTFAKYHNTWEGAHKYLMGQAENRIEGAEMALKRAIEARDSVLAMKKPGEE